MDLRQVYDRGVRSSAELDELELMVYSVKELETYSAAEGWDAFFIGSRAHLCSSVRDALTRIGDDSSLLVLDDYQRYLAAHGVPFEPRAIEEFVTAQETEHPSDTLDWGDLFARLEPERWRLLHAYLESQGVNLRGSTAWPPVRHSLDEALAALAQGAPARPVCFVERVLHRGMAWAIEIEDGLKCRLSRHGGKERVLLMWSSERVARRAAAVEPPAARLRSVLLDELLHSWLPTMAGDGLLVGLDPDGRLEQEEVGPIELRDQLLSHMDESTRTLYEKR